MRESGEDYLETIYILSKAKPELHAIDIANKLNYSKPSITRAMNILKNNGYIEIDESKHIQLTKIGKAKAEAIFERHQIIAKYWIKNGISEENAFKDACQMEHDISEETFSFIKESVLQDKK